MKASLLEYCEKHDAKSLRKKIFGFTFADVTQDDQDSALGLPIEDARTLRRFVLFPQTPKPYLPRSSSSISNPLNPTSSHLASAIPTIVVSPEVGAGPTENHGGAPNYSFALSRFYFLAPAVSAGSMETPTGRKALRAANLPALALDQFASPASPPPLRIMKSPVHSPFSPSAPPRVSEDEDQPLRAAILRNAAYLFPEYALDQLSIATGTIPPEFTQNDAFPNHNKFALVYTREIKGRRAPRDNRHTVVRELAKSPMGCSSRKRALEGLLAVCESAVGLRSCGVPIRSSSLTNSTQYSELSGRGTVHSPNGDASIMVEDYAVSPTNCQVHEGSETASPAGTAF